jgi:hypothetical protein
LVRGGEEDFGVGVERGRLRLLPLQDSPAGEVLLRRPGEARQGLFGRVLVAQ